jgi:hypothetical protein
MGNSAFVRNSEQKEEEQQEEVGGDTCGTEGTTWLV